MLYAATERKAAFLETLQAYRPALDDLAWLAHMDALEDSGFPVETLGRIPSAYFSRRIAAFRVSGSGRFLDLRATATHAVLRTALAADLLATGYEGPFNFGEIIGADYRVTQRIATWAFDHGCDGVVYPSAHDHHLSCWALFERARVSPPEIIRRDDPDLIAAATLFGLTIPGPE